MMMGQTPTQIGGTAMGKSRRSMKPMPSESFAEKVIKNVNNTLKPPNWTVRKKHLTRLNTQASPSCASNIDYHLEQLSSIYKESGRKVRQGVEPSLME